jgi:para-nitrobenzyl esterase
VREALERPPYCKQALPFPVFGATFSFGDEDCLYLNVWSPRMSPDEARTARLPVMVWIHGGANTLGGSSAAEPSRFAEQEGVIVLSLQYRLGILGWFSHPAFRETATTDLDRTSNFALLDMVAALQWVQANIAAFGGDPDNVTIFGQSAGAFDVLALLAVPQARGLYHKAISQSGNISTVPRARAENYVDDPEPGLAFSNREYVNRLLVADGRAADRSEARAVQDAMSSTQLVEYLRGKPANELFDGVTRRGNLGYFTPTNIRDGLVLPEKSLLEVYRDPRAHSPVPVILGSNRDEYKFWLSDSDELVETRFGLWRTIRDPERYDQLSAYFSDQWQLVGVSAPARALHSAGQAPVYTYRLDWAGQPRRFGVDESRLYGAAHGIEVVFLFGADSVSSLPDYARPDDRESWDTLSRAMLRYWANFARTGEPGGGEGSGLPRWQPWTAERPMKMILDGSAGGGLRMTSDNVFAADLKQRLRNDPALGTAERCELYAQLFLFALSTEFWDEDEYERLACNAYSVEDFEGPI